MDDQTEQNLRKTLNQSLFESSDSSSDSILTGDQRSSYPPGQMIDNRFRIIRELGRGGTGTVYQVEQILLRREYAMKILDPIQVNDEAWRRFQKEAHAAGLLDHPGFVKVHDFGLINNQIPFFTMDLVDGNTLSEWLRRHGPMPVAEALPIFIQLCFALDYAHSKGVIHRDVKPSNISLIKSATPGGDQIKILDFGIAKLVGVDTTSLTQVGSVFGTPFYMSPEQCLGQPVDLRSDIYSLGCVFFEMLAGATPFTSENALALMMQHQSEKPPSLKEVSMGSQFPAALEALVQKMLSKKPADRYQRLVETANDLIDLQQGKAPTITVARTVEDNTSLRKKGSILISVALVAITAIIGAIFFYGWQTYMQPKAVTGVAANNAPNSNPNSDTNTTTNTTTGVSANTNPGASANFNRDAGPQSSTNAAAMTNMGNGSNFDDVLISARYFSTPVTRGKMTYRVFKFPMKSPLGDLQYIDLKTNKPRIVPAVGEITLPCVPGHPLLSLTVNWNMCSTSPQLLKKFRPDEVGYLNFADNDARKTFAEDDIFDNALSFVDDLKSIYGIDVPGATTDASLEHLARLPNLNYLGVAGTKITGGNLKKLPTLQRLKVLKMSLIKDGNLVLPALRHSKHLIQLNAVADNIQDSDLKYLAGLPLEGLLLRRNPKITDAGLNYLAEIPTLQRLTLDECSITPKAIPKLSKMKIRDSICLDFSKWSKADVAALLKAVPYDVCVWNSSRQRAESIRHPPTDSVPKSEIEDEIVKKHVIAVSRLGTADDVFQHRLRRLGNEEIIPAILSPFGELIT